MLHVVPLKEIGQRQSGTFVVGVWQVGNHWQSFSETALHIVDSVNGTKSSMYAIGPASGVLPRAADWGEEATHWALVASWWQLRPGPLEACHSTYGREFFPGASP
jgi:hypothetical protein